MALSPLLALSPASATPTEASGPDWTITSVAGGYQVTLNLDEPLPVVSDAPVLRADGTDLGLAVESADGLSLTAFTTDRSVLSTDSITKGWSSGTDKAAEPTSEPAPTAGTTRSGQALQRRLAAAATTTAVSEDPATPGRFDVTEAEYDFGDQAIPMAGISGLRGEMTGKLYLSSATGARPVVLLMHGRHTSCSTGTANPLRWPCGDTQVNVRSYLGYEGTARALASHGYNVVSIAVNAVNSNDNQLAADYGAQARGQMALDTLDMLRNANAGAAVSYYDAHAQATLTLDQALAKATTRADAPAAASSLTAASLAGRFDLGHVGMMGHSRGGEGVMSAATLNQGLAQPYGIEAVLPLAPVDFGRMTLPNTPMMTMLPYCDGDVSNQQGQHMYDDSRNAFDDNVQRSAVWVMGTNHNFFNSVWTPGKYAYATSDDWRTTDTTSSCATTDASRLDADEQYQVGVSYMTGYFRYTMGGENQFAPLFDGSTKPSTPETTFADVRVMSSQPQRATRMIADFTTESSLIRTTGTAVAEVCMNGKGVTLTQSRPLCVKETRSQPHWAQMRFGGNVPAFPVTQATWTAAEDAVRITVPKAKRNVTGTTQMSFKTMPAERVVDGTDFTLTLIDGSGQTWSALGSELNPLAVNRLPGKGNATLDKLVMQQVTVPTADITGINLADLAEITFTPAQGADAGIAGGIYLSDLAFETTELGTTVIKQHTTINVGSVSVDEGDSAGTVDVPVWLNKASATRVAGYVSSVGSATGTAGIGMTKVSFAPGETCKVLEMPLQGNTTASAAPTSRTVLSVTNTQGAVMGQDAFGWLTLREDDGLSPDTVAPAPVVGQQGDACAEALAARTSGQLKLSAPTVLPGESLTVTGAGFRAGESVAFTSGEVELGRTVATASGAAVLTIDLDDAATLGSLPITATGAGTGITATATASVAKARIALTSSASKTAFGSAAKVTATVTGISTGTVTFRTGRTETSVRLANGTASFTLPATLAVGSHAVSVTLTGEAGPTVSASVTQVVTRAATQVSAQATSRKVKLGKKATLRVNLAGATAGARPTGTIRIMQGSTVLKSVKVGAAAQGVVKVSFKPKKKGTLKLRATYTGDTTFTSSTSGVVTIKVTKRK